jgi:hypothetical protein
LTSLQVRFNAHGLKYPNQPFKIAAMSKWVVVVSGKQYIDDIRKAPDEVLSLVEAIAEVRLPIVG